MKIKFDKVEKISLLKYKNLQRVKHKNPRGFSNNVKLKYYLIKSNFTKIQQ